MCTRIGDAAVERTSYRHKRSGFTILELLVVFVVAGVLVAIFGKGLASAFAGNSRTSAVRVASAALFQARAIAIQRSRPTTLVRSGNTLKITTDSSGTPIQVGKTIDLNQRFGVTLGSASTPSGYDQISFDQRGLITGTPTAYSIIIMKGSNADTICATGLGNTRSRGC